MNFKRPISYLLAASALAASSGAAADSGFYIGGSAGGATLEADLNDVNIPGLPTSIDEDDTAIKVFLGYHFDLPAIDLGIEGGYVDFGEPDVPVLGNELLLDTTGVNLWGIASIEAGPVDVFGKLGYIMWEVDADLLGQTASEDGTDIGYGAGVRFNLGSLQIRGEYEIYDLDGADLGMVSVGVAWQFN